MLSSTPNKQRKLVKRTVSLHSQLDDVVRRVQASMIENGWKTNYSHALNIVLAVYFFDVVNFRKSCPNNAELVRLTREFIKGSPLTNEDVSRFNAIIKEIGRQYVPP